MCFRLLIPKDAGFTWNSQHDTNYPVFLFNVDFWSNVKKNRTIIFTTQQIYTLVLLPSSVSIEHRWLNIRERQSIEASEKKTTIGN